MKFGNLRIRLAPMGRNIYSVGPILIGHDLFRGSSGRYIVEIAETFITTMWPSLCAELGLELLSPGVNGGYARRE